MSNQSIEEYIDPNDNKIVEDAGDFNSLNSTNKDSQLLRKSNTNSATFKSPKAKRIKMVHAPLMTNLNSNINEIYLEQLSIMKSRVSMLEIGEEEDNSRRYNSAGGQIIYVKPAECIENISNIIEESSTPDEIKDHFDEDELDGKKSFRNSITPRMFEVPPKKVCVRMKTPNCTLTQNISLYSMAQQSTTYGLTEDKSTNTEGTWIRISLEDIPNTIKSKSPVDPKVIIHRSSNNTSRTSIEDARLETISNITSIDSPDLQISPCSPQSCTNLILPSSFSLPDNRCCQPLVKVENSIECECENTSIRCEVIKNGPLTSNVRSSTSSGRSQIFNIQSRTTTPDEVIKRKPYHYREEIEIETIHESCNIPVKNLGEIECNDIVKEVVNNLALHFFKLKDKICPHHEMTLDSTVEEKVSFKSLVEEVPNEVSENEKKVQDIRRILNENIEYFRNKNVYVNRRPQITQFRYYNVLSAANQEIGAGENILKPDSIEDINEIIHREASDGEEDDIPPGCCTLKALAEFMFPKKTRRYFD